MGEGVFGLRVTCCERSVSREVSQYVFILSSNPEVKINWFLIEMQRGVSSYLTAEPAGRDLLVVLILLCFQSSMARGTHPPSVYTVVVYPLLAELMVNEAMAIR